MPTALEISMLGIYSTWKQVDAGFLTKTISTYKVEISCFSSVTGDTFYDVSISDNQSNHIYSIKNIKKDFRKLSEQIEMLVDNIDRFLVLPTI